MFVSEAGIYPSGAPFQGLGLTCKTLDEIVKTRQG